MRFPSPLVEARLIRRYKRFLADVQFADGSVATVHVANPGSMIGLTAEGSRVLVSRAQNPARKLAWSLELIEADGTLVGVNTAHPNRLVADAIGEGTIVELAGYGGLRREVAYGKNSRIDILLTSGTRPDAYVEVKNVHLSRRPPRAEFPDSVTARGAKHLDELAAMVRDGMRGVMVYLVHRADAVDFTLARDLDPAYAAAFDKARAAGVEMLVYGCQVTPEEVAVAGRLPLID
jgi:sugar fermentation stimulation protein A